MGERDEQAAVDDLRRKEHRRNLLLAAIFWASATALPIVTYLWWQTITDMWRHLL